MTSVTSYSWPKHVFRIATLVVPSAIAWSVVFSARHSPDHQGLVYVVTYTLGLLWLLLAAALVVRTVAVLVRRGPPGLEESALPFWRRSTW